MTRRYIENPLTIILWIILANSAIDNSNGLKLAKEIDISGTKTIGILSKLDIMDADTDSRKSLLNEKKPFRLCYVGIKNRSNKDLNNKLSMIETLKKERIFKIHPVYKIYQQDILIQMF